MLVIVLVYANGKLAGLGAFLDKVERAVPAGEQGAVGGGADITHRMSLKRADFYAFGRLAY